MKTLPREARAASAKCDFSERSAPVPRSGLGQAQQRTSAPR